MKFNADKHLYTFESTGRVFYARNGVMGVEPASGLVWEGGSRIAAMASCPPQEQGELLEEIFTQWLTWANVPNPRTLAQLTVAFAMHVERGGSLPAFSPKEAP
jgi:hypothetical protein